MPMPGAVSIRQRTKSRTITVPPAALYALPLACKAFRSGPGDFSLRTASRRSALQAACGLQKPHECLCRERRRRGKHPVRSACGQRHCRQVVQHFTRIARPGARLRVRFGRDPRARRHFISCALDPAVRFEKCMHAGGARSAPRATKCSAGSRIRSPPTQSTPPRLRQSRSQRFGAGSSYTHRRCDECRYG